jgi:flavin reductase (DIM6/NTAB) family NADH-FMN oxidoreductase RutF
MKKFVDPFDYAGAICKAMGKGILLTTKCDGKVNTMTIGWGMLGIEWGKPIFLALVRESRHTMQMLNGNGEFTVNIPVGEIDKKILGFCGSKSGRDLDKIQAMNLTLEEPDKISVPGIRQLPLTLECKVLYRQAQNNGILSKEILDRYYPGEVQDHHTAFYAEIVSAYVIED